MRAQRRTVVIIGGGFGGLSAAQALAKHPVQITVIDRRNHHRLAAVSTQQGKAAAENIWRDLQGHPRIPFRYVNKGTLAAIGRKAAVAALGRVHLSGFIAWAVWVFVHILLLLGFRNRLMVLREWAWAYFTRERSGRLITGSTTLPGWHQGHHTRAGRGQSESVDAPLRTSSLFRN